MSQVENCQYKVLDRVYYVNFDELVKKIRNGSVLRYDPVKIGNAVWTDAQKIPELAKIFEENDLKNKLPEGIDFKNIFTHFQIGEIDYKARYEIENKLDKACAIHSDKYPYYICTICENLFCRDCPAKNTEKSRICPFCGGDCVLYMGQVWQFENKKSEARYDFEEEESAPETLNDQVVYTKLTFRDFINALVYPFRFPLSLLIGGILFSALVFGQIATLFQGGKMLLVTLCIGVVIIMLKFSILSKCFENLFHHDRNFSAYMPEIGKFSFFEDFIRPFFTGLHSYLVSFGLCIILAIVAGFYAWLGFSGGRDKMEAELIQTGEHVNSVITASGSDAKIQQIQESELREMINKSRSREMEAVFGSNHLADDEQLAKLLGSLLSLTLWFQMPICFAFVLGVLFFPAVCLAVGEDHSQSMKKRFISSFKMMKTIGFDYVKILFISFILIFFSFAAIYGLSLLFSKLQMPVGAIFSALVGGSFLIFYFWVVFSNILSTTLNHQEKILSPE